VPVALVAVAVVVASLVAVVSQASDGDDVAGDGGDRSATTAGPAATPEAVKAVVAELSDYVEAERGLAFKTPVEVVVQPDAEFEAALLADFEEESRDDVEEIQGAFRALGIIGPDEVLMDVYRDLLGAAVLGRYDPESDELFVRGGDLGPYVKETIVHELVHALDDQHYDIDRPEYDDAKDEVGFGFSALVEGSAKLIETRYRASLPTDVREQLEAEEQAFAFEASATLFAVPFTVIGLLNAPYERGPDLVKSLLDDGCEVMFAFEM
jgi:hypothetical protein